MSTNSIDILFENFNYTLPKYVPAYSSLVIGLITTVVITIIGIGISYYDKHETKDSKDLIIKNRWIILTLVMLYIGIQIGDLVKDKHYMIKCLTENKQHFANVVWLKEYVNAIRF